MAGPAPAAKTAANARLPDGHVTALVVLPNQQVEQGDPLLRVKSSQASPLLPDLPGSANAPVVDLAALVVDDDSPAPDVFDDLTAYLLGFDLDPAAARALRPAYRSRVASSSPADPDLLAREDAFLDLFADIGVLYRPRTEADVLGDPELSDQAGGQEYVIEFLRWLDADRAGLPARYRRRLERVLARYGVDGVDAAGGDAVASSAGGTYAGGACSRRYASQSR